MADTDEDTAREKGVVLITGAMGRLGRSLSERLGADHDIVGVDLPATVEGGCVGCDLTVDASVELAFSEIARAHGRRLPASPPRRRRAGRSFRRAGPILLTTGSSACR